MNDQTSTATAPAVEPAVVRKPDPWTPFERAMERAGVSMFDVARACATTRQAVIGWRVMSRKHGRLMIPDKRVLQVERALKGAMSKERMAPHLYKRAR